VQVAPARDTTAHHRAGGFFDWLRGPASACLDCGEPTRNHYGLCDDCLTRRQAESKRERADEARKRAPDPAPEDVGAAHSALVSDPAGLSAPPTTPRAPATEPGGSRHVNKYGLHRLRRLHVVVGLAALLALAAGWAIRGVWDARDHDRASAECEALATYSHPGLSRGFVSRRVDQDQWRACMRGKGFEPRP
jgi:hypothetical protein